MLGRSAHSVARAQHVASGGVSNKEGSFNTFPGTAEREHRSSYENLLVVDLWIYILHFYLVFFNALKYRHSLGWVLHFHKKFRIIINTFLSCLKYRPTRR